MSCVRSATGIAAAAWYRCTKNTAPGNLSLYSETGTLMAAAPAGKGERLLLLIKTFSYAACRLVLMDDVDNVRFIFDVMQTCCRGV
jgi:hypothetical protein